MLVNRYDWSFATIKELIFLIFVITFDRDDSFISDFNAKDKHSSFAIYFREESKQFFSFINFFIVNNRFFNIFIAFFKSSKAIESWMTFVAILTIFFARSKTFECIFFLNCARFLLMRINSRNRDAIWDDVSFRWKERKEKTTKDEKICRLLKSTKEKSKRFSASDITRFENSIAATELSKANEKVSKIRTILIIFFIEIIIFFLNWLLIFFFLRLVLSKFWKKHI